MDELQQLKEAIDKLIWSTNADRIAIHYLVDEHMKKKEKEKKQPVLQRRDKQMIYDAIVAAAYKELNDTIEEAKNNLEEVKDKASEKYKRIVEKARNDSY